MALFVDGPSAMIDDLVNQDCGLLDVAQTCSINVTTKLALAHEDIATDLQLWLDRPRVPFDTSGRPRMEQIVCTPILKRWEAMHALELFYRDAYYSQLADRYQAKWNEYTSLARTTSEKFLAVGMGLVNDPVHQAVPPVLGSVAGPQHGGTFYGSVAWLNAAGQEGAVSVASSITIIDGHLMTVTSTAAPSNVTGFNVYAGSSPDAMYLQNNVQLPTGATFTYVPGFIGQGRLPSAGQLPEFTGSLARRLLRG
jgi:hypothetical protein